MNAPHQRYAPDTPRRSKQVALVLLGTVGVVGGVIAWDAWKRANEDDFATMPLEAPKPVAADREYQNNDFTPGVGYYHAPYHAWYPYPYNHHDPARGYFAGGLWQAAPFVLAMMNSRPNHDAVLAAQQAQQARLAQQNQQARQTRPSTSGSFFTNRSSSPGAPSYSSRPATPPSTSKPSVTPPSTPKPTIQRGGFGSSGHSSGGSSGA